MISASSFLLWNISFLLIDIFNFTTLHITSNYCMQTRTRRYEKISSRNSVALALIESVILTKDEAKCVPIRNQKFIIIASKHGKKKIKLQPRALLDMYWRTRWIEAGCQKSADWKVCPVTEINISEGFGKAKTLKAAFVENELCAFLRRLHYVVQ